MNRVTLQGNIGQEPTMRATAQKALVANFSVAVTRRWKDRNGERQQDTTWVNCVAWEPVSKIVEKHVHKGDPILLEGRWTNEKGKDGATYSKVTVENLYLLPRREPGSGDQRDDGRTQYDHERDYGDGGDLPF
jgi:single-strand DNA-binding protein